MLDKPYNRLYISDQKYMVMSLYLDQKVIREDRISKCL